MKKPDDNLFNAVERNYYHVSNILFYSFSLSAEARRTFHSVLEGFNKGQEPQGSILLQCAAYANRPCIVLLNPFLPVDFPVF